MSKPKGSAGREIKNYPDFRDKMRIAIDGVVAKYPEERGMYMDVLVGIPLLRANAKSMGLSPAQLANRVRKIEQRVTAATVEAIKNNDVRFFEKMTEIAKFYKDRKSVAHPLYAGILGAISNIEREKKLSSQEIADYMNRVWPRTDGVLWDPSEVRRGIREMKLNRGQ